MAFFEALHRRQLYPQSQGPNAGSDSGETEPGVLGSLVLSECFAIGNTLAIGNKQFKEVAKTLTPVECECVLDEELDE